jgi:glycosyltransferase involved in cell wall biosynthesis
MDQIVRQADCGYIIEYGNVRQLEDAIAFYADEPQMQHQHGLNARRAYEQQYSWEKMRLRLLELYQQLASAAGEN